MLTMSSPPPILVLPLVLFEQILSHVIIRAGAMQTH